MRHFVIGTAGHIDHGKTSLVKALTGIDCDTHPEEKKRGITINPGFAYLRKSDDEFLSFIDMPGHNRFINNMISGAVGVDFLILVIAADDGVMPQTEEHLKIASLLGIRNGITVITKCDLADDDYLDLCQEEITAFLKGSFLENAPVFRVSSSSGKGMEELRNYLLGCSCSLVLKPFKDNFRLYVDRAFNVAGFGVIVTGTVSGGKVSAGDELHLYPADIMVRVRNIQHHKTDVQDAFQGDRVALDLIRTKKEDIVSGSQLSSARLEKTCYADAWFMPVQDNISKSSFVATMLSGTFRHEVKARCIASAGMSENVSGKVAIQIHIPEGAYLASGDYYILRDSASNITLGGGRIVDPMALVHRKHSDRIAAEITGADDSLSCFVNLKSREGSILYPVSSLATAAGVSEQYVISHLPEGLIHVSGYILSEKLMDSFEKRVRDALTKFNRNNPLCVSGMEKERLIKASGGFSGFGNSESDWQATSLALDLLAEKGSLVKNGNQWQLAGATAELSERDRNDIEYVVGLLKSKSPLPFTEQELASEAVKIRDAVHLGHILKYLTYNNIVLRVADVIFLASSVAVIRAEMIKYLSAHPEGLKMGEFRELSGLNRKYAVILFEYFEKLRIIRRTDDIRYLP